MTAFGVTVTAFGGGVLRGVACAFGIHKVTERAVASATGPGSIRYCVGCGESDDARWRWDGTEHRYDLGRPVSFVRYREAEP